jgi:cysteine-rich repeat protein
MARHILLIPLVAFATSCGGRPAQDSLGSDASTDDGTESESEFGSESESSESESESESETETDDTGTEDSDETTGEAMCGDGFVDAGEDCDDGNTESFDGCTSECLLEHPVLQLSVGHLTSCVLTDAGLKCWGANGGGQLGLGDTESRGGKPNQMGASLPFVDVGFEVAAVDAGAASTCALGTRGQVKCWGFNEYGQLGLGDTQWRGDEPGEMGDMLPVVDLGGPVEWVVAGYFGCARLEAGLRCWGYNQEGQLGLGDTDHRGDDPGEMGDALPFVELGFDPVELVTLQASSSCARDALGRVKCWGDNSNGGLGLGNTISRGGQPGQMGDALPFVDLGLDAEVVGLARWSLTCAVLASGTMKCWGATTNLTGAPLWPGADNTTGDEPGEMGDALPELSTGDGRKIVEVAVGQGFYCVRLDDGGVRCAGYNKYGQLGQGHSESTSAWLEDLPDTELGEPAVQIEAGDWHVCALLQSRNVKCWGRGEAVGLGYGDTHDRGDEPGEMGEALPYVPLF